ncbi:YafY family transcriptional regulator [Nocardia otitidiscaviarum]|uniref:YafY family transcriptional regulator n=1 Tax=Nocardia otitidiscaviarum TaxID=1823 RepID=A0A516NF30_9NOCA|nr:YafY family protein [Nocardia otitidiscaviarum]MCP9622810.1 YafY family transcriptional regulator [Nocardia otitidiscaviarum]QDP77509.1 YafY family transcriptional regulator [Nocardia otitidiscaviarum]
MLETSARLLRLLSLLQTPRDWTGSELAERLEVDVRTVRRDIDKLRTLGYPVDAVAGAAGYRLGAGAKLPPLLLDDDEAIAVAVGLRTAAGGTIAGIEESSLRALAKLERVLPSRLRHRVAALEAATVTVPAGAARVDPDVLTTLAAVIRDHERLRFDYRTHQGTESRRTVEPHRLVHTGRHWYLLGWDVDRDDWRTYRVDRLTPRIPTGPRFTPRDAPEIDPAGFVSRGVSTAPYRYQARITLFAPAAVATDRIAPTVGVIEAVDADTCVLHTGSDSLDELAVYVGVFGFDCRIHEPPELIAHIRTLTARLTAATE